NTGTESTTVSGRNKYDQTTNAIYLNQNHLDKVSLCLTNYNRTEMLYEAFHQVLDDERIDEIIISDDDSNDETVRWLKNQYPHAKVKIYWHEQNVGMSRNKAESLRLASNQWCILFDSDNVISTKYLDALF